MPSLFVYAQPKELKTITTYYAGALPKQVKEIYQVQAKKGNLKQGFFRSYSAAKVLLVSGQYQNNQPHGSWQYFFESGKPKVQGTYQSGKASGEWAYYFENGQVQRKGNLLNGNRIGLWQTYFETGVLKAAGTYIDNKQEGKWTYYYETGALKSESITQAGIGSYKEYYESGTVKAAGKLKNNVSDSIWLYYFESGKLKAKGNELNGQKTGTWLFYYENDSLQAKGEYINGKKEGNWTYFHPNGKVSSAGAVANDMRQGPWTYFFQTGEAMGSADYKDDACWYKETYENGSLKCEGRIDKGKYEGEWKYFYPSGELEGSANFINGKATFNGFHPNGKLKTSGQLIENNKKYGKWALYNDKGELTGYYQNYDEPATTPLLQETEPIRLKQKTFKPAAFNKIKRGLRYYTPNINEDRQFLLSFNPFATFLGSLPVYGEFYIEKRLGFEGNFTIIRAPFFEDHGAVENRVTTTGTSLYLRQKLYHPISNTILWFWGQELRYSNLVHQNNLRDPTAVVRPLTNVVGQEYLSEFSLVVGMKMFSLSSMGGIKYHADAFAGWGVGYREFVNPSTEAFGDLDKRALSLPPRIGFSIGLIL